MKTENFYRKLITELKNKKNDQGFWQGYLSSSALAVSVAIVAMKKSNKTEFEQQIEMGFQWLLDHQNKDGGFGDSPESQSNTSTSLLCYAAISFCGHGKDAAFKAVKQIDRYLQSQNIFLNKNVENAILSHYGKDFTFSVPILSMLAICGIIDGFEKIPQLPFELALLPHSLFRFFNLQVVSYAIPALIAVGIANFTKRKNKNKILAPIRKHAIQPALKKLLKLVPNSGGFLEAIPLTAFVCMCLIESGFYSHKVVEKGIYFLKTTQRQDGSWPIDRDLSTWVTTLSIKAFGPKLYDEFSKAEITILRDHLMKLQYKEIHPFNQAKPGGWGWTDATGSVPDADDTPGAILALLEMYRGSEQEIIAITKGCQWLVDLQNKDGGIPTFCKGWGKLPFDRSCADLTGHAFLAIAKSFDILNSVLSPKDKKSFIHFLNKATKYLEKHQSARGRWLPLWFGNQNQIDKKNPVYGTAKVCIYLEAALEYIPRKNKLGQRIITMTHKARHFLLLNQNADSSWGAEKGLPGSFEETALAASALANHHKSSVDKAMNWLKKEHQSRGLYATPIGLYFASLWYDEELYPLIYIVELFRRTLASDSPK